MIQFTPEMIEKARKAKSAEELLALAKENEVEMTEEEAKVYFEQLNAKSGELSDDELDNVVGGGCHSGNGRLVVTVGYACENWVCICGGTSTTREFFGHNVMYVCSSCRRRTKCCENCRHMSYERGLWLCNHPANKG